LKFYLVETRLKFRPLARRRKACSKILRDGSKINISEKIRMKILAACKLCSDVLVPVRSQPKIFAGAAQMRFCRTASSCETQGLTAVPPPRATSSADDSAKTVAALIYTSKSLNRCGILAYIILNFYDFSFHIRGRI